MPRPVWISGKELATICVSRIAMNIPTAMATNPIQVLMPIAPAGVGNLLTFEDSEPSPRRENALLDPDAPDDHHQVHGRKRDRDRDGPKGERQHGDFRDHQQVVRVPNPAERAGLHQGCAGQGYDPRRPITAQAGNYPEPTQLEQREQAEQRPDRRSRGGYEEGKVYEPAGMQQDEKRVAFGVRLHGAQPPQLDGIAAGKNELDNALQ